MGIKADEIHNLVEDLLSANIDINQAVKYALNSEYPESIKNLESAVHAITEILAKIKS